MRCKDCGLMIADRIRNVLSRKLLESGRCFGCFRIWESEKDPELKRYLDIKKFKSERRKRRKENGWK